MIPVGTYTSWWLFFPESNITVSGGGGLFLFTASFHLPPGTFSSFFARPVIVNCVVIRGWCCVLGIVETLAFAVFL